MFGAIYIYKYSPRSASNGYVTPHGNLRSHAHARTHATARAVGALPHPLSPRGGEYERVMSGFACAKACTFYESARVYELEAVDSILQVLGMGRLQAAVSFLAWVTHLREVLVQTIETLIPPRNTRARCKKICLDFLVAYGSGANC